VKVVQRDGQPGFAKIDMVRAVKLLGVASAEFSDEHGMPRENHLIPLTAIYHSTAQLGMVSEAFSGVPYVTAIAKRSDYCELDVAQAFARAVTAIKALHAADVVHGNLLVEDLVVSDPKELDVMVMNYGLAGLQPTLCEGVMAPECLQGQPATKATDIWGLGALCYMLLVGYAPFSLSTAEECTQAKSIAAGPEQDAAMDKLKQYDSIVKQKCKEGDIPYADLYWRAIGSEAKDLVSMMLVVDPAKRPTLQQIESHPFLNSPVASPDDLPEARQKFQAFLQ